MSLAWSKFRRLTPIVRRAADDQPGDAHARRHAGYAASIVGFLAYAAGLIASFWLSEPHPEDDFGMR